MPRITPLFLAVSVLSAGSAYASPGQSSSGFFGQETKRIGVTYVSYSGDQNRSLTGTSGLGIEAAISRGNSFLQVLTKLHLEYASGSGKFLDSATELTLDYRLLAVNAGLALRISPVTSSPQSGLGIYFGAGGSFGMAQLSLPIRSYTTLKASESATTLGYDFFAGVELGVTKAVFIEAALKTSRTVLGGNTAFQLDALVLQGGLVW